jgi:hypothetical protein
MKIQTISLVLMSLVSALTFISLATAQQSKAAGKNCHCSAEQTCVGGHCIPNAIVPPENASSIDINKCSAFGNTATCDLPTNRITMPKNVLEKLIKNR